MVAETRNHLIAASQNISTAIGFMAPIKIPYWSEADAKVSEIGTENKFIDGLLLEMGYFTRLSLWCCFRNFSL